MKEKRVFLLAVFAVMLSILAPGGTNLLATGGGGEPGIGGENPCFTCYQIRIPDPYNDGQYFYEALCWDFGYGSGWSNCIELGGPACLRWDPCSYE